MLTELIDAYDAAAAAKARAKERSATLNDLLVDLLTSMGEGDVKSFVVEEKWLGAVRAMVDEEVDRALRQLAARLGLLANRYEASMPRLMEDAANAWLGVEVGLGRMGIQWKP